MSAVTVEHLDKRYGSFTAVRDVSFDVAHGQVTAFLGPNGAGKTTIVEILLGCWRQAAARYGCSGPIRGRGGKAAPGGRGSAWCSSPPAWTRS